MKLLVAASNELPTQGEGLEALWDRFLIRIISTCVKQEEAFYQMLLDDGDEENRKHVGGRFRMRNMPDGKRDTADQGICRSPVLHHRNP